MHRVARHLCPLAIVAGLAVSASACLAALPEPASAVHRASAYETVAFPPPPARPEGVPVAPDEDAVWIDGEWRWGRRHWRWVVGRWVIPPADAKGFARSTLRVTPEGRIQLAPGAWQSEAGEALAPPPALASATVDAGGVVDELGAEISVGPNGPAQRPTRGEPRPRRPPVRCRLDDEGHFEGLTDPSELPAGAPADRGPRRGPAKIAD